MFYYDKTKGVSCSQNNEGVSNSRFDTPSVLITLTCNRLQNDYLLLISVK